MGNVSVAADFRSSSTTLSRASEVRENEVAAPCYFQKLPYLGVLWATFSGQNRASLVQITMSEGRAEPIAVTWLDGEEVVRKGLDTG